MEKRKKEITFDCRSGHYPMRKQLSYFTAQLNFRWLELFAFNQEAFQAIDIAIKIFDLKTVVLFYDIKYSNFYIVNFH